MKKKLIVFLMFVLFFSFSSVKASTKDKIIANSNINLSEEINGDLYFAGNSITINGNVNGDIIGAGNDISIKSDANNNIRVAGNVINITNTMANNMTIAGSSINFNNVEANHLYGAAETIEFSGIASSVKFSASTVTISGTINEKSTIYAEKVVITENAKINATLNIKSEEDIEYVGNVDKTNIKYTHIEGYKITREAQIKSVITDFVYAFISVSILALIILGVGEKVVDKAITKFKENPAPTLLYGLLFLIALPIIMFMLLISVVGIPLSFITMFIYIVLLMIAKAFTAVALSKMIFENNNMNKYLKLLLSVLIICVATVIPFIKGLTYLLCFSFILGSAKSLLKKEI